MRKANALQQDRAANRGTIARGLRAATAAA